MKSPAFWNEAPGYKARFLGPFGWLYGKATAARMHASGAPAGIPVVCVGNFTAGGAGKTPAAILVVALLQRLGETPFILSRGYGGSITGPLLVDPQRHTAAACGDEPLLLVRHAPTIVAADRIAGAAFAKEHGASVIVMDDGLQNPSLRKDFSIAVVDAAIGLGNGYCLPAGPLRAPLASQMPKTDAVMLIGTSAECQSRAALFAPFSKPVLHAELKASSAHLSPLQGIPLLAFAGIGRPAKFFETLRSAGLRLVQTQGFADHHPYTPSDIAGLREEASKSGLQLVTTEKDAVRLAYPREDIAVLPVQLQADEDALTALLSSALSRRRSANVSREVS
ncbi:MAG: tetraacyldisaccharide 4'-kinase [Beijerinckiaceae bacterium]